MHHVPPPLRAGFAVVKKGRDKRTGEAVAIKVRAHRRGDVMWGGMGGAASLLPPWARSKGAQRLAPAFAAALMPQVVDKSRYAAGDNSLEREIQVLIKVGVGVAQCSTTSGSWRGFGGALGDGLARSNAAARPPSLGVLSPGPAAAAWRIQDSRAGGAAPPHVPASPRLATP